MRLQQTKTGLTKETGNVTLGIEKSQNLGITLLRNSENPMMITMQLDNFESATLCAYLGGEKFIRETLKNYEALQSSAFDRMEELRDLIRKQKKMIEELSGYADEDLRQKANFIIGLVDSELS
jgi:hypothetical protein